MNSTSKTLEKLGLSDAMALISSSKKTCEKHGIQYTEEVYKRFTRGCPKCREEAEAKRKAEQQAKLTKENEVRRTESIQKLLGEAKIPVRFRGKTIAGYEIDPQNEQQQNAVERIKIYAHEFDKEHSGRNMALLGNAGTGKTHLACAVANYIIQQGKGTARFSSVSEINRLVREAKSYNSLTTESDIIRAFGSFDLLIIDEVGVQSGTEAESRALFEVFNSRYQNLKPTILISNLTPAEFKAAVGDRIADRVKEDGGEVLIFGWESNRGM